MRAPSVRVFLVLNAVALAAATAGFLLAAGLPLAARDQLSVGAFTALVIGAAVLLAVAGSMLLARVVARPVNRLLAAAARLDPAQPGHRVRRHTVVGFTSAFSSASVVGTGYSATAVNLSRGR